jgi:hypothetical protein
VSDDIVATLALLDVVIRDCTAEIADPNTSMFVKRLRLSELPQIVELRAEVYEYDRRAVEARETLLYRAARCVDTNAKINAERKVTS